MPTGNKNKTIPNLDKKVIKTHEMIRYMQILLFHFRRQRTAEEASKLAHVQTELQKIDLLVAQDVKILRQTIEVASVEYMQAK